MQAQSIDDVLSSHNDFLGNCLTHLMVDKEHLLKILTKLLVICEEFVKFSRAFFESIAKDLDAVDGCTVRVMYMIVTVQIAVQHARRVMNDKVFVKTISSFDSSFGQLIKLFIDALSKACAAGMVQLGNLALRLDTSGYYSENVE